MLKIYWLRNEQRHPVACIASEIEGERLAYGIATFNPKDKFDKERGRHIAMARMEVRPYYTPLGVNAAYRIMTHIAASSIMPLRTQVAARLWLDTHIQREEPCSTQTAGTTTS